MNIPLIKKMVAAGVIRQNTEVEASYMGTDLSGRPLAKARGTFFIQSLAITKGGRIQFTVKSTVDGSPRLVESADVHLIDGMPIDRLAGIYGIDTVGGEIAQGKRRGRKPRAKLSAA
jgi:hypothetical protein